MSNLDYYIVRKLITFDKLSRYRRTYAVLNKSFATPEKKQNFFTKIMKAIFLYGTLLKHPSKLDPLKQNNLNFVVSFIGNHCPKCRGSEKKICPKSQWSVYLLPNYMYTFITQPWYLDQKPMCDRTNKVYCSNRTCVYAYFGHFLWCTLVYCFFF